jgi:thiamine monophosphate synthase
MPDVPLIAIGGITLDRVQEVRAAGADSVAIISALFTHPLQIEEQTRSFLA